MAFTEKEKRDWHAKRKAQQDYEFIPTTVVCAHCGSPVGIEQAESQFPICDACDD